MESCCCVLEYLVGAGTQLLLGTGTAVPRYSTASAGLPGAWAWLRTRILNVVINLAGRAGQYQI
eukprot:SAG31_NODE_626_length_13460_cov_14.387517_10_plen_64_part_00